MTMTAKYIFLLLAVSAVTVQSLKTFTAAVYEHVLAPVEPHDTAESVVKKNLKIYEDVARTASVMASILIFPENGLISSPSDRNSLRSVAEPVPDPKTVDWNPCVENPDGFPVMKTLSCLARNTTIIIAANFLSTQECSKNNETECPEDGVYIFNTDVVFDSDGKLLARYHKIHLFFAASKNVPPTPEHISFNTKFGTVAIFTCFDLVFEDAVKVIEESKAEIVFFPTQWFDQLPLQGAALSQQGFAIRMNVTLLAANIHAVSRGTVGSGIYYGAKGAVNFTVSEDNEPKLLISRIPPDYESVNPRFHKDVSPSKLYQAQPVSFIPESNLVQLVDQKGSIISCQNDFCCTLRYEKSDDSAEHNEQYFFVVFNGTNVINGHYKWCAETCFLARCEPSHGGAPCRVFPVEAKTSFKHIHISGGFSTRYVFPAVSSSGMNMPGKSLWDYSYTTNEAQIDFSGTIDEPILGIGLYGRCYERDPPYKP